jgi:hypothetical protein
LFALLLLCSATRAHAQADTTAGVTPCLRFRFDTWKPALDWKRSGHPSDPDSVQVARAAGGQAFAVGMATNRTVAAGDTLFVLYVRAVPVILARGRVHQLQSTRLRHAGYGDRRRTGVRRRCTSDDPVGARPHLARTLPLSRTSRTLSRSTRRRASGT